MPRRCHVGELFFHVLPILIYSVLLIKRNPNHHFSLISPSHFFPISLISHLHLQNPSSTSYRRCHRNQDVTHKTHCDCDPPHLIPVQTAWTLENAGRRFKGCPICDKDKKCGVYGFLDLELPSDYYKRLLYDLHEENKALKRMNKMSGVMKDSSNRLPNYSNNQMVNDLKDDLTFVKSKLKVYDRLILVVFEYVVFLNLIVLSSDTNKDMNEAPSVASVPKEGPSVVSVPKEGPSIRKKPSVRPELANVTPRPKTGPNVTFTESKHMQVEVFTNKTG
ncbi:hypothetical protein Tco_0435733 [Tanacetum coccineum]